MTSKNKFLTSIVCSFILCILLGCLNYIIDPFQYFRRNNSLDDKFHTNQRFQVPGMIKNIKTNSFVVGTSMGENFNTLKIDSDLNWKNTLRISISGIMPSSQKKLLNFLKDSSDPQNIIMDLHWYLTDLDPEKKNAVYAFPEYLYSHSIWGKIKYLINSGVLKESINLILSRKEKFQKREKLNNWMNEAIFSKYTEKENIKKLSKKLTEKNNTITLTHKVYKYPSFEKNILPFLKSNSDIQFYLFLPPYSTWYYKTLKDQTDLQRLVFFRYYLVQATKELKNVKIFAVDENRSIVNNVANYKDYGHYRDSINQYIIDSIKNSQHIITNQNINIHMENFIKNINNYNEVLVKPPYN